MRKVNPWNIRKCACMARYVPLQVMDLQVKYHYYTICTLLDMDLNQELNQSVTDKGNTICHIHIHDRP